MRLRGLVPLLAALASLVVTTSACSFLPSGSAQPSSTGATSAPAPPPAAACDHPQPGPAVPPAGAVRVDPSVMGDLTAKTDSHRPGTVFWLAPGRHRLGGDRYSQVRPKTGDSYIGAPGAVVDGAGTNMYAFVGDATDVTVSSLVVRGFVPPLNEGVVNHDSAAGWLIEHDTITQNRGAGMMAGARQVMRGNCLKDNGQYGLNAYGRDLKHLVLEGNEFTGNNADDVERKTPGCGCSGGMKFWAVDGADIRGNWIHDNHGPGIWADTNNNDFLVEKNLIEGNDGAAVLYETSYNAIIRDNLVRRNNLVEGKGFADRGDSFPAGTVYISESGGDPRVPARTDKIDIYRNVFEDNWSGITLWENADRFCNSAANTSTGSCTLLVSRTSRCSPPAITGAPLLADCRWKTQRVDVHDNRFSVHPAAIGCKDGCARMAVLSNYGTFPAWSPYKGTLVEQAITFDQQNRWHGNTYVGPWTFTPMDAAHRLTPVQWQAAPYRQDAGSTFSSSKGAGSGSSPG